RQYHDGDYAGEVRIASNDVDQTLLAVPCAMHVGLLTDPALAQPAGFDAVSVTPLVRFALSPPVPASSLVAGSLELTRVPVRPALERELQPDGRLVVSLEAVRLLALLGPGPSRPATLSGEYPGAGWFSAATALSVAGPEMAAGPLPAFGSTLRPYRARAGEP